MVTRADTIPQTKALRRAQTVTWTQELTATWQESKSDETLGMRSARYVSYMCPSDSQLRGMCDRMQKHVAEKLSSRNTYRSVVHHSKLPLLSEVGGDGIFYAVEVSPSYVTAARVCKTGKDCHVDVEKECLIRKDGQNLTCATATAFDLFELIAKTVAKLPYEKDPVTPHQVAFVTGFNVSIRQPFSCVLKEWSRGMKTGGDTDDPVIGGDMTAMLAYAFERLDLPFEVVEAMQTTTAIMESALATIDTSEISAEVRFVLDLEVGVGAACLKNTTGELVDVQLGHLSEHLPCADFDLEVDDADGNYNTCMFEKLTAHRYLSETSRRVIIKLLLSEAPEKAWTMYSLPMHVLSRIVADGSDDLNITRKLIKMCWDWEPPVPYAVEIRRITKAVMSRSAALMAAAIVSQARATRALQPALGGSVVVVSGVLYRLNKYYSDMLQSYIKTLVGPALSSLLVVKPVTAPLAVGGALRLARLEQNRRLNAEKRMK